MEHFKPIKIVSTLNRKQKDPGKFIFTGKRSVDKIDIQLFKYNKEACIESQGLSVENIEKFDRNGYNYWLNIHGLNDTQTIAALCERQEIHSLVTQDILDVDQRPKYQEFENFFFLTLKSVLPAEKEMITEQISFVFGANFLISFQERKAEFFEHLRFRLREDKGMLREPGTGYLLYVMLESILDNYFLTLNRLDEEIENFNLTNTKKEPSPHVLEVIESHKKFVHFIKRSILPIKEFTQIIERGECPYINRKQLKFFLEIKDLCLTLLDSSDLILTSLESSTNLFFSIQGHRMNQVMKTLTIISTIFIPLTFIAGIYGMNFPNMPELHWKYGYLALWVLILFIFSGMMIFFRKKKWF